MVQTRGKRAAASPPPAPEPEAKKQAKTKRGKKSVAVEPINEDDEKDGSNEVVYSQDLTKPFLANKPAVKKQAKTKKGKKSVAAEPISEDDGNDGSNEVVNTQDLASPILADRPEVKKQTKAQKGKKSVAVKPMDEDDDSVKVIDAQVVAKPSVANNQNGIDSVVDAQVAVSSNLAIPVDDHCPLSNYRVYIDPKSKVIYDASLNQTNATANANKFYRVQLLESPKGHYQTWTRWGRVGEHGQSATLSNGSLDDALKHYEKKFKDKSGLSWSDRSKDPKKGKYVFIEKSYLPDEDEPEPAATAGAPEREQRSRSPPKCTLAPPVRSLIELVFNQTYFDAAFVSMNYDANKLPLGKLSKVTITRGFQALKDLAAVLRDPAGGSDIEDLSNMYYSLIPHAFGRNRPPVIRSDELLKKEIELLESLSEMKAADDLLKSGGDDVEEFHPLDRKFHSLGLQEMTPLAPESSEFTQLSDYLTQTCGQTHNTTYAVQDIFRIERQGELDRFTQSPYATVASDRRLLWHGSRATNYGGILSQGLRIAPPEAPVNGYMFDKGIYLADMSSKSANYCASYISGGEALLLLCEAELGAPMQTLTNAKYDAGEDAKKMGVHSTWGQGNTGPKDWKDAACVHPSLAGVTMPDTTQAPGATGVPGAYLQYNEYICYDVAQVRLRYLLRVRM